MNKALGIEGISIFPILGQSLVNLRDSLLRLAAKVPIDGSMMIRPYRVTLWALVALVCACRCANRAGSSSKQRTVTQHIDHLDSSPAVPVYCVLQKSGHSVGIVHPTSWRSWSAFLEPKEVGMAMPRSGNQL